MYSFHGLENVNLYHGSALDPSEFMKAPAIHVGDIDAAYGAGDLHKGLSSLNAVQFSDNSVIAKIRLNSKLRTPNQSSVNNIFSDWEANQAHSWLLEDRGIPLSKQPKSIRATLQAFEPSDYSLTHWASRANRQHGAIKAGKMPAWTPESVREHMYTRAAIAHEALKRNMIVPYKNENFRYEGSGISYVVPSPWLNLRQVEKVEGRPSRKLREGESPNFGRDPLEQPVLPLDYSGSFISAQTEKSRSKTPAGLKNILARSSRNQEFLKDHDKISDLFNKNIITPYGVRYFNESN